MKLPLSSYLPYKINYEIETKSFLNLDSFESIIQNSNPNNYKNQIKTIKNILKLSEIKIKKLSKKEKLKIIKIVYEKVEEILLNSLKKTKNLLNSEDLLEQYFLLLNALVSKKSHVLDLKNYLLQEKAEFEINKENLVKIMEKLNKNKKYFPFFKFIHQIKSIVGLNPVEFLLEYDLLFLCFGGEVQDFIQLELVYNLLGNQATSRSRLCDYVFVDFFCEDAILRQLRGYSNNQVSLVMGNICKASSSKTSDHQLASFPSRQSGLLLNQLVSLKTIQIILAHLQLPVSSGVSLNLQQLTNKTTSNGKYTDLTNNFTFCVNLEANFYYKCIKVLILNNSSDFDLFYKLFTLIKPFFHPSLINQRYIFFLKEVCWFIFDCYKASLDADKSIKNPVASSETMYTVKKLKELIKPLLLKAIFAKEDKIVQAACDCFRLIITVDDGINDLLDLVKENLLDFNHPHRVNSVVLLFNSICEVALKQGLNIEELFWLVIEGIDLNDLQKSFQVMSLLIRLLMNMKVNEEMVDALLNRMFKVVSHMEGELNEQERLFLDFCEFLFSSLVFQIDADLDLSDRLLEFAYEQIGSRKEVAECIGGILSCYCVVKPCSKIILNVIELIKEEIVNNHTSNGLNDLLVYYLVILKSLVSNVGLLVFSNKFNEVKHAIEECLGLVLDCDEKKVYKLGCKVFKELVGNMGDVWCLDYCSHEDGQNKWGFTPQELYQDAMNDGRQDVIEEQFVAENILQKKFNGLSVKWHVPSEKEKRWILELYQKFIVARMDDNKIEEKRACILLYGLSGTSIYLEPWFYKNEEVSLSSGYSNTNLAGDREDMDEYSSEDELDEDLEDAGAHEMSSFPSKVSVACYYTFPSNDFIHQTRQKIASIANDFLKNGKSDNVDLVKIYLKILRIFINGRGIEKQKYDYQIKGFNSIKRAYRRHDGSIPRWFVVRKIGLIHLRRIRNNSTIISDAECKSAFFKECVLRLVEMSIGRYSELRIIAQHVLSSSLRVCANLKYDVLTIIFDKVQNGNEHEVKGALYLLELRCFMNVYSKSKGDYRFKFVKAMMSALKHDKVLDIIKQLVLSYSSRYSYPFGDAGGEHETEFDGKSILKDLVTAETNATSGFVKDLLTLTFFELFLPHLEPLEIDDDVLRCVAGYLDNEVVLVRKLAVQVMSRIMTMFRKSEKSVERDYKYYTSEKANYDFSDDSIMDQIGIVVPKEIKCYRRTINSSRKINSFLKGVFSDKIFWEKFIKKQSQDENFSLLYFKFYKALFSYFVNFDVSLLTFDLSDKLGVKTFCETVSGLLQSLKKWDTYNNVYDWLLPKLLELIKLSSPETIPNLQNLINLGVQKRNYQRFTRLIDIILKLEVNEGGITEAKKLSFKKTILNFNLIHSSIHRSLIEQCKEATRSDYKAVRDTIAAIYWELLSVETFDSERVDFVSLGTILNRRPKVADLTKNLNFNKFVWEVRHGDVMDHLQKELHIELEKDSLVQGVVQFRTLGVGILNFAKTVLRIILEGFASSKCNLVVPYAFNQTLILDLLHLQYSSDDIDLQESLATLLTIYPDVPIPPEKFCYCSSSLVSILKMVFKSTGAPFLFSRKSKLRMLAIIQIFCFRNRCQFNEVDEIFDIIIGALGDGLAEVRQLASNALCGLVQAFYCDSLIGKLLPKCKEYFKTEIHAAVLGLSAVILAFPYEIPDWLPDTLVLLAEIKSKSNLVNNSIKHCFAEFRRTHQDHWKEITSSGYVELYGVDISEKGKGKFKKEHLEKLEGYLTTGASYYA